MAKSSCHMRQKAARSLGRALHSAGSTPAKKNPVAPSGMAPAAALPDPSEMRRSHSASIWRIVSVGRAGPRRSQRAFNPHLCAAATLTP